MTEAAPQVEGQVADAAPEAEGQAVEANTNAAEVKPWYDGAPDEVAGYIKNKGWDNPLKAVEGYQNLEKFHGVSPDMLIKLPKDPSAEGAFDEIYNKLGRPESPDKYELNLPEGVPVDQNRVSAMAEVAHKAGLNPQQLNALAAADAQYQMAMQEAVTQQQTVELNALQKEWGEGFAEREELARRFIRSNMPEGADKEALLNQIEGAIGTAAMLKLFANAGSKTVREHDVPDTSGDRPFGYTREQALSDKKLLMDKIKGDKTRLDNYNKGIGADIDEMKRLNKILAG